jgi:hypothetical protein
MPTVRITGNVKTLQTMEWAGKAKLGADGKIERSIDLPEELYLAIERQLLNGGIEGTVVLENGRRFEYFVDR